MSITLSALKPGDKARIVALDAAHQSVRFFAMGLFPGAEMTLLHKASQTGPLVIALHGVRWWIRPEEWGGVSLEKVNA